MERANEDLVMFAIGLLATWCTIFNQATTILVYKK